MGRAQRHRRWGLVRPGMYVCTVWWWCCVRRKCEEEAPRKTGMYMLRKFFSGAPASLTLLHIIEL